MATATPRNTSRELNALAVGAIVSLAALANLLAPFKTYDGGLAGSAGTFLLHGALPYRDFWWLYGPGAPVVAAIPTALLGPSVGLLRLLGLALVAVQGGLIYFTLRPRLPHLAAALFAIGPTTAAVYVVGLDITAWSVGLTLAMFGLVLHIQGPNRSLAAGLLIGAAFAARLDVGSYALLASLIFGSRRSLLVGFALVAVPVITIGIATAPLADLFDQLVVYPIIGPRQFRSLPLPDVDSVAALEAFIAFVILPKIAVLIGGVRILSGRDRSRGLVLLTAFAGLCQLQTLGRADLYHQAQAAIPGYLLLGWAGSNVLHRVREPISRPRAFARLGAFALVSSSIALTFLFGALSVPAAERGPLPPDERALIAAIRTLDANTDRDESVYVGLTNHRFTFVNDMLAYYLADRRSGVRVAMFNPGVTNTDGVQSAMASDLSRNGIAILLLDDQWANFAEPQNRSSIPGSTILDQYISSRYHLACDYGSIRILATPERLADVACAAEITQERMVDVLFGIGPPS
jgi:hypothetical protein